MSPEAALHVVNDVESKALTIVDQAKAVQVTDAESYTAAGSMWKTIGEMIAEVKGTFDPICEAANKAHKAATAKRASFLDPLQAAQKQVKQLMSKYDEEQERIRRAEEARLAEIARQEEEKRRQEELAALEADRKAEEERLLQAALEAEAGGDKAQAEELMQVAQERTEEAAQAAAEIQAAPVYVAPVVVPKATPKLQGGPVYQERWYAQVTSIKDLCRAIGAGTVSEETVIGLDRGKDGIVSSPALNKMAVALKATLTIPGVKAYSKRV